MDELDKKERERERNEEGRRIESTESLVVRLREGCARWRAVTLERDEKSMR